MERAEAVSDWLVKLSGWVLAASVLLYAGGGRWDDVAGRFAAAGLAGLVAVPPLRLAALAGRLWRAGDRLRATMAAFLLVLLAAAAGRHV